jgi:hypothetical protein
MNRMHRLTFAALTLLIAIFVARDSDAFCGFYVGGAGAKLFNDATVVVLMREGTRTVLSMQNTYKGPPEKFAMVVPVPVILQEENVKTLKRELFDHVDQLASPRLVEYWEQDPCAQESDPNMGFGVGMKSESAPAAVAAAPAATYGVTVEAQFTVGEYQIVILSAKDSNGLEAWLHDEHYTIPEGAEPYFRPYVVSGSKFFVAKVDPQKVKLNVDGLAELSPLRFHYDSDEFRLPVRLGLINSSGTQDLIVHILGRDTRYEVANYPNVTIPTNLDVAESARDSFGTFYTTLFDRTIEKNPKAVVTEYAWEPTNCDPCPGPALDFADITTLGGDVLPSSQQQQPQPWQFPSPPVTPLPVPTAPTSATPNCTPPWVIDEHGHRQYKRECLDGTVPTKPKPVPSASPSSSASAFVDCSTPYWYDAQGVKRYKPQCLGGGPSKPIATDDLRSPTPPPSPPPRPRFNASAGAMVLTRLHVRYTKETLGEDLVFKAAPPIVGGRETMTNGALEKGAQPSSANNFQARYAVRHAWTGPIDCKDPRRGVWGGRPGANRYDRPPPSTATKLGLVKRASTDLASYVKQDIPEIGFKRGSSSSSSPSDPNAPSTKKGCTGCAMTERTDAAASVSLSLFGVAVLAVRRRKR